MKKSQQFNSWNIQKQKIDKKDIFRFIHEREVWNGAIGINIGHEQNGGKGNFRPILVIKVFNRKLFLGIPLTSQTKEGKYYFSLSEIQKDVKSTAILSQIRLFDTNRLSKNWSYSSWRISRYQKNHPKMV